MGCCYSSEKPTVYEVTLDNDGVAHRVPDGQGTHYIHVSESNETVLEVKPKQIGSSNSTFQRPLTAHPHSNHRIHPSNNLNEKQ
ncbi:hypothetical protein BC941DRAFT_476384 [Chlamydoabsidia padenii]|nr:hypothetical protein BC941DRAFT_476384 [Chlamydoabsidia padenii]